METPSLLLVVVVVMVVVVVGAAIDKDAICRSTEEVVSFSSVPDVVVVS